MARLKLLKICYSHLPHSCSSLPSGQSGWPLQCKCPDIHERSLHWYWSTRHVMFWQFSGDSSEPSGQSLAPSQSQLLWIHVSLSLHSYSLSKQNVIWLGAFGQPFKPDKILKPKFKVSKIHFTYLFIFSIDAVILSVASPFGSYAKFFGTLQLSSTGNIWAIFFVWIVSTIVV